jgi:hypothetical protein
MRGAMVGGLGYMAGKAGAKQAAQESSQGMEGGQPPAAAPAAATAPPAAVGSSIEQLKQLGELRDSGVLTPDEFEREKQKILAGGGA